MANPVKKVFLQSLCIVIMLSSLTAKTIPASIPLNTLGSPPSAASTTTAMLKLYSTFDTSHDKVTFPTETRTTSVVTEVDPNYRSLSGPKSMSTTYGKRELNSELKSKEDLTSSSEAGNTHYFVGTKSPSSFEALIGPMKSPLNSQSDRWTSRSTSDSPSFPTQVNTTQLPRVREEETSINPRSTKESFIDTLIGSKSDQEFVKGETKSLFVESSNATDKPESVSLYANVTMSSEFRPSLDATRPYIPRTGYVAKTSASVDNITRPYIPPIQNVTELDRTPSSSTVTGLYTPETSYVVGISHSRAKDRVSRSNLLERSNDTTTISSSWRSQVNAYHESSRVSPYTQLPSPEVTTSSSDTRNTINYISERFLRLYKNTTKSFSGTFTPNDYTFTAESSATIGRSRSLPMRSDNFTLSPVSFLSYSQAVRNGFSSTPNPQASRSTGNIRVSSEPRHKTIDNSTTSYMDKSNSPIRPFSASSVSNYTMVGKNTSPGWPQLGSTSSTKNMNGPSAIPSTTPGRSKNSKVYLTYASTTPTLTREDNAVTLTTLTQSSSLFSSPSTSVKPTTRRDFSVRPFTSYSNFNTASTSSPLTSFPHSRVGISTSVNLSPTSSSFGDTSSRTMRSLTPSQLTSPFSLYTFSKVESRVFTEMSQTRATHGSTNSDTTQRFIPWQWTSSDVTFGSSASTETPRAVGMVGFEYFSFKRK